MEINSKYFRDKMPEDLTTIIGKYGISTSPAYVRPQNIISKIFKLIKRKKSNLLLEIKRSRLSGDQKRITPKIVQSNLDSGLVRKIRGEYINRRFELDSKIDIGKIDNNYQVIITERGIDNPFVIDNKLIKIIKKYTANCKTDYEKASAVFNWIEENIDYGDRKRDKRRYRNSGEVLETKEGVCGEMAYLYIAMVRSMGLKSNFVDVDRDCDGKKVLHACASVETEKGIIFVDPAYHRFDINHRRARVLNDEEAIKLFKQFRY